MDDTEEEFEHNDKRRVTNTLKVMGINVELTKIERIGTFTKERKDHEGYRPIKVHLESKEVKIKVLKKLKKLKNVDFRITENLTKQERNLVKEWSDQAKKRIKRTLTIRVLNGVSEEVVYNILNISGER